MRQPSPLDKARSVGGVATAELVAIEADLFQGAASAWWS
jgi:hypothetical protein